jgi:ATP-dependent exoDNAse (exonuclease V) beta subunit
LDYTLSYEDVCHYQNALGFDVPLPLGKGDVYTGHIDIVQIRNGQVHILDYKPDAKHVKPIEQLMIYALALARRSHMLLYHFRCAWFDDRNYYEFYPLHVVRKNTR